MEFKDVIAAVLDGKFDDNLDKLNSAIKERKEIKGRATFYSLTPGDKVRFVASVKPQYLAGCVGTLRALRNKKVTVDLDEPTGGRFQKGIITPVTLIEKV